MSQLSGDLYMLKKVVATLQEKTNPVQIPSPKSKFYVGSPKDRKREVWTEMFATAIENDIPINQFENFFRTNAAAFSLYNEYLMLGGGKISPEANL